MNIGSDATQSARLQVYQQQADKVARARQEREGTAAGEAAPKGDSVSLSGNARLMAEADRAAREAPDVRQDKVVELKEQVQNGTYKIDNQRIAEGLLREDMGLFSS